MNTGDNCTGEVNITSRTEVITSRIRIPANKLKADAMKDFIDILGEEDIDTMFIAILETGQTLGYNLAAEPRAILARIEKQYA